MATSIDKALRDIAWKKQRRDEARFAVLQALRGLDRVTAMEIIAEVFGLVADGRVAPSRTSAAAPKDAASKRIAGRKAGVGNFSERLVEHVRKHPGAKVAERAAHVYGRDIYGGDPNKAKANLRSLIAALLKRGKLKRKADGSLVAPRG